MFFFVVLKVFFHISVVCLYIYVWQSIKKESRKSWWGVTILLLLGSKGMRGRCVLGCVGCGCQCVLDDPEQSGGDLSVLIDDGKEAHRSQGRPKGLSSRFPYTGCVEQFLLFITVVAHPWSRNQRSPKFSFVLFPLTPLSTLPCSLCQLIAFPTTGVSNL